MLIKSNGLVSKEEWVFMVVGIKPMYKFKYYKKKTYSYVDKDNKTYSKLVSTRTKL